MIGGAFSQSNTDTNFDCRAYYSILCIAINVIFSVRQMLH